MTVLIPTLNAGKTILRAVQSALVAGAARIIILDSGSTDDTVACIESLSAGEIQLIALKERITLGAARQQLLKAVETEYACWLDADDAFLPNHIEEVLVLLGTGKFDIVCPELKIFDGLTGEFLRDAKIPEFVKNTGHYCRIFERNYLPGPGVVGLSVAFAKTIGYDDSLESAEDFDFLLRSLIAGGRFTAASQPTYQQFIYPDSLSRNIDQQRSMVNRLTVKHRYPEISELYRAAGVDAKVTEWGLCSMALFRGDYLEAGQYLDRACPFTFNPDTVLEPDGPCRRTEGWRFTFVRGTLDLLLGQPETALTHLLECVHREKTPEGLNNLGVGLRMIGDEKQARGLFVKAIKLLPSYLDARLNLDSPDATRITTHPLRSASPRPEYTHT
jgi:glycosyltransferase involved in cell wall biosynthesis